MHYDIIYHTLNDPCNLYLIFVCFDICTLKKLQK